MQDLRASATLARNLKRWPNMHCLDWAIRLASATVGQQLWAMMAGVVGQKRQAHETLACSAHIDSAFPPAYTRAAGALMQEEQGDDVRPSS